MTVFMFPGQGAQKPGMGADLLGIAEVAQAFAIAGEVCGVDVAALAREGSAEQVNDAYNAQVLAAALSVGLSHALDARGIQAEAMLGFSLGQISALMASGVLSDEDGFALLDVRARSMAQACKERPGAMYALLGAAHEDAQGICDTCQLQRTRPGSGVWRCGRHRASRKGVAGLGQARCPLEHGGSIS